MTPRAHRIGRRLRAVTAGVAALLVSADGRAAEPARPDCPFNDSHFHLTNYTQEGPTMQRFLVRKGNFARLFDAARPKVRAWEKANPGPFAVRLPGQ